MGPFGEGAFFPRTLLGFWNFFLFLRKYSKIKQANKETNIKKKNLIMSKLDKENQQKEPSPKRRHKDQRPTHSHIQESHKNTKLEEIIYVQRTRADL